MTSHAFPHVMAIAVPQASSGSPASLRAQGLLGPTCPVRGRGSSPVSLTAEKVGGSETRTCDGRGAKPAFDLS